MNSPMAGLRELVEVLPLAPADALCLRLVCRAVRDHPAIVASVPRMLGAVEGDVCHIRCTADPRRVWATGVTLAVVACAPRRRWVCATAHMPACVARCRLPVRRLVREGVTRLAVAPVGVRHGRASPFCGTIAFAASPPPAASPRAPARS